MKAKVYKLFVKTYLEYKLPLTKVNYDGILNSLIKDDEKDLVDSFFKTTITLIDLYAERIWFDNDDLVEEMLRLIFRFIELGHERQYVNLRNLYRGFTNKPKEHKNRTYFTINEKTYRLLNK